MSRSWICMVLRDWTMRLPNRVQAMETHVTCLLRWRDVLLGLLGAFAKEIGFHLLHNEFLVLFLPGLQAVFVEQHLHVLLPLLPSQLRYVFVDALSQGAVKGRLVESLHFAPHFCAVHHPCHVEILHRCLRDKCQPTILRELACGTKPGWPKEGRDG